MTKIVKNNCFTQQTLSEWKKEVEAAKEFTRGSVYLIAVFDGHESQTQASS